MTVRRIAAAMLVLLAACAAEGPANRSARTDAATNDVTSAYRAMRMAEHCAEHAVNVANGAGRDELGLQRQRLARLLGQARANGLAAVLDQAERDWQHFQSVAEWVCDEGSGPRALGAAVTQFERAVRGWRNGKRDR